MLVGALDTPRVAPFAFGGFLEDITLEFDMCTLEV
jgi:hypothetical protein